MSLANIWFLFFTTHLVQIRTVKHRSCQLIFVPLQANSNKNKANYRMHQYVYLFYGIMWPEIFEMSFTFFGRWILLNLKISLSQTCQILTLYSIDLQLCIGILSMIRYKKAMTVPWLSLLTSISSYHQPTRTYLLAGQTIMIRLFYPG